MLQTVMGIGPCFNIRNPGSSIRPHMLDWGIYSGAGLGEKGVTGANDCHLEARRLVRKCEALRIIEGQQDILIAFRLYTGSI